MRSAIATGLECEHVLSSECRYPHCGYRGVCMCSLEHRRDVSKFARLNVETGEEGWQDVCVFFTTATGCCKGNARIVSTWLVLEFCCRVGLGVKAQECKVPNLILALSGPLDVVAYDYMEELAWMYMLLCVSQVHAARGMCSLKQMLG